jgi:hypothetical protein
MRIRQRLSMRSGYRFQFEFQATAVPDFLYSAPSNGHVCGPGQPGPHEVHQRQQTSQEIRGFHSLLCAQKRDHMICLHYTHQPVCSIHHR